MHFILSWEESKVPTNIDPYTVNLSDSLERKKLAEILAKGLDKPVGYVIPLEWNYWNNRWLSCRWEFRNDRLVLIPGNSAMGLRLPLKSLPYTAESKVQRKVERSPFEELPQLTKLHEIVQQRYQAPVAASEVPNEFYSVYVEEDEDEDANSKKKKSEEDITGTTAAFRCLYCQDSSVH